MGIITRVVPLALSMTGELGVVIPPFTDSPLNVVSSSFTNVALSATLDERIRIFP